MNIKRIITLAIVYIFFIIAFISATKIVLSIPYKNIYSLKKSRIDLIGSVLTEFNYKIDSFNDNQDILYTVEFLGWAFIPSDLGNDGKEIKLVFVSDQNQYEVETELQERFDLRSVLQEYNISDYKQGFITKFSPLEMKNGVYKLYIYCYENEGTSGIVDTQKVFMKTYRTFSETSDKSNQDINQQSVPNPIE